MAFIGLHVLPASSRVRAPASVAVWMEGDRMQQPQQHPTRKRMIRVVLPGAKHQMRVGKEAVVAKGKDRTATRSTVAVAAQAASRLDLAPKQQGWIDVGLQAFFVVFSVLYASMIVKVRRRSQYVKRRAQQRADADEINPKIAKFYDLRSEMWENVWGEHMHHGFYPSGKQSKGVDPKQAQIDMMDRLIQFGGGEKWAVPGSPDAPKSVLDVGCGIGGATRYLARRLPQATVTGVTLSPVQVERGNALNEASMLGTRCKLQIGDAMRLPFADKSFDLVWSLESVEHYPDKMQFFREAFRVLKPGGRLLVAAWCHRECPPALTVNEQYVLLSIYEKYCISYMCSGSELENQALRCGFRALSRDNWTKNVEPFWDDVVKSAFSKKGVEELMRVGPDAVRSALAMRHMIEAFQLDLMAFTTLSARKP
ncbi:putative tocopherol O-methyltransferase, chloroplastic [Porphyridium purpureum]|uniref:Putative tocopherol O-methyltransferase, chloroplastic n=1 Tax=Porphyridium purpureum TaxID=35688 RepID=A0A5J4YK65_PORPP|nr:putative tocopherol O-methyltransferase, chloroplastic [Porphyridium purpureum]|eukprot:POR0466..scf244_11